jgi:hypothetical protein
MARSGKFSTLWKSARGWFRKFSTLWKSREGGPGLKDPRNQFFKPLTNKIHVAPGYALAIVEI